MLTSYQLNNSDGTVDRYTYETVSVGNVLKTVLWEINYDWEPIRKLREGTNPNKYSKDLEVSVHSRFRKDLFDKYRHRYELNTNLSTKLK